jgi:hypothetical protein
VANVNLYATAEFNIRAASKSEAVQKAGELLDRIEVCPYATLDDDRIIPLQLQPENVEPELLSVEEGSISYSQNFTVQRLAEAQMGALLLREMHQIAQVNDSEQSHRTGTDEVIWCHSQKVV